MYAGARVDSGGGCTLPGARIRPGAPLSKLLCIGLRLHRYGNQGELTGMSAGNVTMPVRTTLLCLTSLQRRRAVLLTALQVLGVEVGGPCRYRPLLRHTPAGEAASRRDGSGAANGPPTAAAAPLYVQRRLSEKAPSDPPGGMGFSDMAAVHLMNGGPGAGGGDAYALTRLGQLGATLAAQQPFLSAVSRVMRG